MQEISDFDENLVNFFPMSSRRTRIAVHGLGWFTQKKGGCRCPAALEMGV
jgi:hypothetical protein